MGIEPLISTLLRKFPIFLIKEISVFTYIIAKAQGSHLPNLPPFNVSVAQGPRTKIKQLVDWTSPPSVYTRTP